MSDQKLRRVKTVREITYQGSEAWVDNTISRMITGTVHIGRNQFIIGKTIEVTEETPDGNIEPDHHISEHWNCVTEDGLKQHAEMEEKLTEASK